MASHAARMLSSSPRHAAKVFTGCKQTQPQVASYSTAAICPTPLAIKLGSRTRVSASPKSAVELASTPGAVVIAAPPRPPSADSRAAAANATQRVAEANSQWKKVLEASATGEVFEGKIASFNEGGVIVQLATHSQIRGFVPYNQLEPARLLQASGGDMNSLIGQAIKAKVVSTESKTGRRDLIMSERKVGVSEKMRALAVGDVLPGVVTSIQDYGAFIRLADLPEAFGLVHITELSWDKVMMVDDVVSVGQAVQVKILSIDTVKCRLTLSIKQATPDPLRVGKEQLTWTQSISISPEVQRIVNKLQLQEGVLGVEAVRQAEASHVSSQELEVFMSKEVVEGGGYLVLARQGTTLHELKVTTDLSRDEMKAMIQTLMQR